MKLEIDVIQEIKQADFTGKGGVCVLSHRDEIIDRYVTRELSEEARDAFDEHCFNCEICFQALTHREEFVRLIKTEGRTIFADVIAGRKAAFGLQALIEKILHPGQLRPLEWAFAAVAALVIVAGGFLIFKSTQQTDVLAGIQYDEHVPYVFTPQFGVALRAPSGEREDDLRSEQFYNRFLAAMTEYKNLNYAGAVELLASLQSYPQQWLAQAVNDTALSIVRDYYFFSGASHLALARSQRVRLDAVERQRHLEAAIALLSQSLTLVQEHRVPEVDRERYFLGLAQGLAGNMNEAILQFKHLQPESPYYAMSQKLVKRWAK